MSTVVLISCVSKKLPHRAKAKDLYISPLFRMNLAYARQFVPEKVFILSAKYGLVALDEEIEPYDVTLNRMSAKERRSWAAKVVAQLQKTCDLDRDHFVVLAGKKDRQHLLPHLKSYDVPFEGVPIGKQLQFLKEALSHE
jgi:hypothetical protein